MKKILLLINIIIFSFFTGCEDSSDPNYKPEVVLVKSPTLIEDGSKIRFEFAVSDLKVRIGDINYKILDDSNNTIDSGVIESLWFYDYGTLITIIIDKENIEPPFQLEIEPCIDDICGSVVKKSFDNYVEVVEQEGELVNLTISTLSQKPIYYNFIKSNIEGVVDPNEEKTVQVLNLPETLKFNIYNDDSDKFYRYIELKNLKFRGDQDIELIIPEGDQFKTYDDSWYSCSFELRSKPANFIILLFMLSLLFIIKKYNKNNQQN